MNKKDKKFTRKASLPLIGTALATGSLLIGGVAQAESNPFGYQELSSGYMIAAGHKEGRCGEGRCGEKKRKGDCKDKGKKKAMKEGHCGEGKCGEGKCGEGEKKSK